ncbi:MAG: lysylphosphatidylglycerol synthase transmembrane domain-containing protein [Trebonia sp.]
MNAANSRRNWKRPLTLALKVAFSAGLIAWVLHKTNLASIGRSMVSASPEWLALALVLGIAGTMVQARQWQRLLLAVGLNRSITRCLRIVFIGNTFNVILPSSIGGDASRAVYIAEQPGERAPGAAAVALQRLLNFPGMVLLMALGLALTINSSAAARVRPVALAGSLLGLGFLAVTLSPLIGRVAASTSLARLPGWKPLANSLRVLDGFRSQHADVMAAIGRGVVFWSLTVLNQWAYIRAMGIHPSLGYTALAVTLVNLATMLPVSINGFGAREGGFIALLAGVGLASTAQAASAGLLITAQSLLFGLIGAGCLLTLRSAAPWSRRVEAGTEAVFSRVYAATERLNARGLAVTFGVRRPRPENEQHETPAEPGPAELSSQQRRYDNARLDAGS